MKQKNEAPLFFEARKDRQGARAKVQYLEDYFAYLIGGVIANVMQIETSTSEGERNHYREQLRAILREVPEIDIALKEAKRKLSEVLLKK